MTVIHDDGVLRTLKIDDLSYDKLVELQERLLAATRTGRVEWDVYPPSEKTSFEWRSTTNPNAYVVVKPDRIQVWEHHSRKVVEFAPATDVLHRTITERKQRIAEDTLSAIMADLDRMEAEA